MASRIRRIQRRAKRQGRGDAILAAIKHIYQRLQKAPRQFGEANYRLSKLRLEVRTCVVVPLAVHLAVHQDKPVVFIEGVKLLSE